MYAQLTLPATNDSSDVLAISSKSAKQPKSHAELIQAAIEHNLCEGDQVLDDVHKHMDDALGGQTNALAGEVIIGLLETISRLSRTSGATAKRAAAPSLHDQARNRKREQAKGKNKEDDGGPKAAPSPIVQRYRCVSSNLLSTGFLGIASAVIDFVSRMNVEQEEKKDAPSVYSLVALLRILEDDLAQFVQASRDPLLAMCQFDVVSIRQGEDPPLAALQRELQTKWRVQPFDISSMGGSGGGDGGGGGGGGGDGGRRQDEAKTESGTSSSSSSSSSSSAAAAATAFERKEEDDGEQRSYDVSIGDFSLPSLLDFFTGSSASKKEASAVAKEEKAGQRVPPLLPQYINCANGSFGNMSVRPTSATWILWQRKATYREVRDIAPHLANALLDLYVGKSVHGLSIGTSFGTASRSIKIKGEAEAEAGATAYSSSGATRKAAKYKSDREEGWEPAFELRRTAAAALRSFPDLDCVAKVALSLIDMHDKLPNNWNKELLSGLLKRLAHPYAIKRLIVASASSVARGTSPGKTTIARLTLGLLEIITAPETSSSSGKALACLEIVVMMIIEFAHANVQKTVPDWLEDQELFGYLDANEATELLPPQDRSSALATFRHAFVEISRDVFASLLSWINDERLGNANKEGDDRVGQQGGRANKSLRSRLSRLFAILSNACGRLHQEFLELDGSHLHRLSKGSGAEGGEDAICIATASPIFQSMRVCDALLAFPFAISQGASMPKMRHLSLSVSQLLGDVVASTLAGSKFDHFMRQMEEAESQSWMETKMLAGGMTEAEGSNPFLHDLIQNQGPAALLATKMKKYIPRNNQDREYVRKFYTKGSVYAELGAPIVLRCAQAAMMHFTGLVSEGSKLATNDGGLKPSPPMKNMCEYMRRW